MQKRMILLLVLCLMGGSVGLAETANPLMVYGSDIVYDGTYLTAFVRLAHTSEEYALVDTVQLDPALEREIEVQTALATGAPLMGVSAEATLLSGATPVDAGMVYSDVQDGKTRVKGFLFILPPDAPREDLTVMLTVSLHETVDGPAIDEATVQTPVLVPEDAWTASIPADIQLDFTDPGYVSLEEDGPEGWTHVEEVYISGSEQAMCMAIRMTGDALYEAEIDGGTTGAETATLFTTHAPADEGEWVLCCFEPVAEMPEKLVLTLERSWPGPDTVSLEVDLQAKQVTLL